MVKLENTFNELSPVPEEGKEAVYQAMKSKNVRVELIRSGYSETPSKIYDQDENEFVMIIDGSAELFFEEGNQTIQMLANDFVNIPAHSRHRVNKVRKDTYWLAVFYK